MPPGRVSRESIRRLLARNGLKPMHADHMGHRPGIFLRQRSDTAVSVSVDLDSLADGRERYDQLREVLEAAGYTLEDGSSDDIPRWLVTRPAEEPVEEKEGDRSGGT